MNKSQDIIDEILLLDCIGRLDPKKGLFQQMDRLPSKLRNKLSEVLSEELLQIRVDAAIGVTYE